MKKAEILSLSWEDQENWLKKNVDDYLTKPYEGDLIGYVIYFHEQLLDEYIEYPEDYETGSLIKTVFNEMPAEREQEINLGSPLSKLEKDYLKKSVVNKLNEEEGGLVGENFTVCGVKCDDGELFVTFCGPSEGAGGVDWSFDNIFTTREAATESVSKNLDKDDYFFSI
tara:strand:- start:63 stop:569 length:507 start_codon:yes stop_codon:yes gene_type:complete